MFANFSFGPSSSSMTHPSQPQPQPQPQHAYTSINHDSPSPTRTDSLSPTSLRSTSPSHSRYSLSLSPSHSHIPLSVADLAHKLSAHTLNRTLHPRHPRLHHPQPRPHAHRTATPSPSCEADDDGETFFERGSRAEANCRRRQRQLHSRMQCDPQHLKALAELVEGMVKAGSQCCVYEAPGVVGAVSSEEEEDEEDGASTRGVTRKQSVEWAKGRTCVSKTVRVRREGVGRGGALTRGPAR